MKQRRTDRILLGISNGCFFVMSASFLLMPLESIKILPGLLFWLGLLSGLALQIVLEVRRRTFLKSCAAMREAMQKHRSGLFSFKSNATAKIADYAMGLSLVAVILAFAFTKGYGYICYAFMATTIFSFCMHCVLNGRIYFYIKNQRKFRQKTEREKVNAKDKGESAK